MLKDKTITHAKQFLVQFYKNHKKVPDPYLDGADYPKLEGYHDRPSIGTF
jgi:hypothetical protein